jgi:hypothetical protein
LLSIVLVFVGLGLPLPAKAHRLDEYLQAARFSVARNGLNFEIDLTPGSAVASRIFSLIDTNKDGRISEAEGSAYAEQLRRSIELSIDSMPVSLIDTNKDGRISEAEGSAYAEQLRRSIELSIDGMPVPLKLIPGVFPELAEMNDGTGMIRLHGTAEFTALAAGRHALYYRNTHEPNISVYLSNALIPTDTQVEITAQHRDNAQDELIIDYRVAPDSHSPSLWWLLVAAPVVGVGAGFMSASFKLKQKIRAGATVSGEESTDSAQRC